MGLCSRRRAAFLDAREPAAQIGDRLIRLLEGEQLRYINATGG